MVLGSDGAWYANAASAAAGSRASGLGVFPTTPDNQAAVFGDYTMSPEQAAAAGLPTLPTLPGIPGAQTQSDITPPAGSVGASISDWFNGSALGRGISAGQSAASSVGSAVSSVGGFLKAISDVSRDVTVVLGLVLIVVGIVALTKHEAVTVVAGGIRDAVT